MGDFQPAKYYARTFQGRGGIKRQIPLAASLAVAVYRQTKPKSVTLTARCPETVPDSAKYPQRHLGQQEISNIYMQIIKLK
jgi:hypothetical protein